MKYRAAKLVCFVEATVHKGKCLYQHVAETCNFHSCIFHHAIHKMSLDKHYHRAMTESIMQRVSVHKLQVKIASKKQS